MQIYRQQLLKVNHQTVTFDGHRHCNSGDTFVLVRHVIVQDQGGQSVLYLYREQLLKVSHHPTNFSGYRHCNSGDILVLDILIYWSCKIK